MQMQNEQRVVPVQRQNAVCGLVVALGSHAMIAVIATIDLAERLSVCLSTLLRP